MRIRVHVTGIKGSGAIKKGEEAAALYRGVLEVDGHMLEEAGTIEVTFSGDGFVEVKPILIPGSFEVVTHDNESWPRLIQELDEAREARAGSGRLVATRKDSE